MADLSMVARQSKWSGNRAETVSDRLALSAKFIHKIRRWAVGNLEAILSDQGQFKKAEVIQKDVIEQRRQILGDEHPDTITAMRDLAATLLHQDQLQEAAAIQKEVLEKRRRILGEEHTDNIIAMKSLAATLSDLSQLKEAAAMQKDALEKMRRILGEDHPRTKTATQ